MTTTVAVRRIPSMTPATGAIGHRTWFRCVALCEALGFLVPGAAWFTVWKIGLPPLPAAAVVVLSGAIEGAILGAGQWYALRRWNPAFSRDWIRATAAGAMVAWACGMAPSTASAVGAPDWFAIVLGISLAPGLLVALPGLQALVLARYVSRTWRWVAWSTAAWALALPPTFIGPALLPADAPAAAIALTWVVAGVLMASILAVVTGIGISRILAETRTQTRYNPWLKSANEK